MAGPADTRKKPLLLYLPPAGSDPVIIACLRETHAWPVTFTRNPVEEGAPVTDHARPEQRSVSLDCVASRTPTPGAGYTDADLLLGQLDALQNTPALVRAVTLGGDYRNMGVASFSRTIDATTANAVVFTLSLVAIRVVSNKFTRVVLTIPKGQGNKKKGAVDTQESPPARAASLAARADDATGNHLSTRPSP